MAVPLPSQLPLSYVIPIRFFLLISESHSELSWTLSDNRYHTIFDLVRAKSVRRHGLIIWENHVDMR